MKLNLGCGKQRMEGWTGVDAFKGCQPDYLCDLFRFPWPWPNDSVDAIQCSHILEHIPHAVAGSARDGLIAWMQECWRILKPGGTVRAIWPHHQSDGAFVDPTHTRFIVPGTFGYFSRPWRTKQLDNSDYAGITCDFSYEGRGGRLLAPHGRLYTASQEERDAVVTREWNVVWEMHAELMAHKPVRSES